MKLVECLQKIQDPKAWDIRFYEDQPLTRPFIHTVTDNLHNLYHEWHVSPPNLSGNQKYVYGIMFADYDGRIFLVDDSEYMTFDDMMKIVERELHLSV